MTDPGGSQGLDGSPDTLRSSRFSGMGAQSQSCLGCELEGRGKGSRRGTTLIPMQIDPHNPHSGFSGGNHPSDSFQSYLQREGAHQGRDIPDGDGPATLCLLPCCFQCLQDGTTALGILQTPQGDIEADLGVADGLGSQILGTLQ